MPLQRIERLDAWKLARKLIKDIYVVSAANAFQQDFSLATQLRRAAISVITNMAGGHVRAPEYERLWWLARCSCMELQSLLNVALDLGYLDRPQFDALYAQADRVGGLVWGMLVRSQG